MVLHNPNNWHWVNKDVSAWAKEYLQNTLAGVSAEESGVSAKVDKVLSMDGDVDVSQRKGKVITLFDIKLQLEYSGRFLAGYRHNWALTLIIQLLGTTADKKTASGTITIPEVAHDTDEAEYVVCSLGGTFAADELSNGCRRGS